MVNGMDIHYAVAGEGPPIVFLHGLGASCVTWQENIGPLSERFTVYTPDFPGHGDSVKLGVEYTVDVGVSIVLGFLDAVGAQTAALAGSSMGGHHRVADGASAPRAGVASRAHQLCWNRQRDCRVP